jgi:hypothetical protein
MHTITQDTSLTLPLNIIISLVWSETPVTTSHNLLSTCKLVLGTAESLSCYSSMIVLAADGEENLANADTSAGAVRFSVSATHTSLKSISTGTGKHFVDTEDVVWVDTNTQVEEILSCKLCAIFVGSDTGGLQGFRGDLLILPTVVLDGGWVCHSIGRWRCKGGNGAMKDTERWETLLKHHHLMMMMIACFPATLLLVWKNYCYFVKLT